jgi:hypothetical protein
MNFQDLHELLRLEVLRRIENGDLTGTRLAQQAGFQQAHISNFLNRKRALSLEGLDRVLASQGLSLDEMVPLAIAAGKEISGESEASSGDEVTMVPIVSAAAAADEGQIRATGAVEHLPVAASWLSDNRIRPAPRCAGWQRFVGLRVDAQQAAAMEPTLASGMIVVIDRHYNSIVPYRAHQPTIYAVRHGAVVLLRHVEFDEGHLILRPSAIDCAVQLISIAADRKPSDYIVGRACLLLNEI